MPTYQYECAHCGHEFDALQSMTEKKIRKCPKCGHFSLQRLIGSGTGIIFKGSGFYETDYKKKSPAQEVKTVSDKKPTACGANPGSCACAASHKK